MSSTTTKWILELVDRVNKPMRTIQQAGLRAEKQTNSVDRALSRLKKNAITAFGAFQAWQGFKGIVQLGFDLEATKVKFDVMLGSQAKALAMINDINKLANKTPFENSVLQKNAELLLNFGVAGKKVIPTMKMLGDLSAGNAQQLESLSLAYGKAQSSGKVTLEIINQMIEGGRYNPIGELAKIMNTSADAIYKKVSKGEISFNLLNKAMQSSTSEGGRFYKMMDKISTTGAGKLSTLLGTLRSKIADFSEKYLVPILIRLLDVGIKIINNIATPIKVVINTLIGLKNWISENYISLGLFTVALIALNAQAIIGHINFAIFALRFKVFTIATKVATAAQWLFNVALNANPIGLVIAGIAVLAGLFVMAYKKVGWFRGAVDGAWAGLKTFAKVMKEIVISRIQELVKGITGIGETLVLFFKGDWQKAFETGKKATRDLLGLDSAKKNIDKLKQVGKDAAIAYGKGVASVEAAKIKTKTEGETETNAGVIPKLDDFLGDTPAFKKDTINVGGKSFSGGGSGGSKSITQNVTVQNIFKVDKDSLPKIDEYAEKIAGKLNDMLRDGMIALE